MTFNETCCCTPHAEPAGGAHHDKGAVEVEALPAALGHHEAGPAGSVAQCSQCEQQHVQADIAEQEEQLAAVVVPVRWGKVARRLPLLLLHLWWLQPVSSTGGQHHNHQAGRKANKQNSLRITLEEHSRVQLNYTRV